MLRNSLRYCLRCSFGSGLKRVLLVVGLAGIAADASAASPARASDWLGHSVITRDGKELGTVRDLAVDEHSGKVVYLVVSVGSFLIENNLIAVAPDALAPAGTDDGVYLLLADPSGLKDATRFASDGQWPKKADVIRSEAPTTVAATQTVEPAAAAPPATASPATGTATIESRSKTAKLSASERVITATAPPPTPAKTATATTPTTTGSRPPPLTQFDHLDKDGDGVLNRSEFAQVISPKDSYSKIDTNANGVIEPQEFDAYQEAHRPSN